MTSTAFAPSSPASVIVEARERVGELHEVLWAAKTPRETLDAVTELERLRSELAAIEAEVVPRSRRPGLRRMTSGGRPATI